MSHLKVLNRWHQWYVIERIESVRPYTDESGKKWAEFEMTVRRRWWYFLHPGYWTKPNRWRGGGAT